MTLRPAFTTVSYEIDTAETSVENVGTVGDGTDEGVGWAVSSPSSPSSSVGAVLMLISDCKGLQLRWNRLFRLCGGSAGWSERPFCVDPLSCQLVDSGFRGEVKPLLD
jgi:hypothetical protein